MSEKDNWRIWDQAPEYGELLYERAVGNLDEMESSKALCDVIEPFYKPGMSVFDVGCGAGHYLRSLMKRVDPNINYTGYDATEYYVELASKAFPEHEFTQGDIFNIKHQDETFDLVMSNNVLLHLPSYPEKAIHELIRVSKKYVVIRCLFGERNYQIKELHDHKGEKFNYFNVYTEEWYRATIKKTGNHQINIIKDDNFNTFDNRSESGNVTGTRVMNGKQISGNILLDWRFIVIEKK